MARALRLAERGLYTTMPNPRVGCVIAHGEEVVGEGWHERAGEPHAEVFALRAAAARARGATAYVTLEPCSHFGRTPPCADALIEAGVARVVAASEDSNPRVAGGGFAKLREAGITVESGLMRAAARELNRGFFSRIEHGRPWLRVKLAMSLDGRTALGNGDSKWITGEAARADVQHWRARSSAILTGSGTVLADDPRLTVRMTPSPPTAVSSGESVGVRGALDLDGTHASRAPLTQPSPPSALGAEGFKPLRVVLDRALRTPRGAHLLDGSAPTLIFHDAGAKAPHDEFGQAELVAAELHDGRFDLALVLQELAARGMAEVQVEAGPILSGALLQNGLVDELLLYVAPVLLGDTARPLLALPALSAVSDARRWQVVDRRMLGNDERILYREQNV
ncbi:MAG: bifunctional diaminohydroxyphosphoribosylaminopyrimidine deaminase/5-amino-6-(5-phosphoribosylamino)uracil reductase RibD [Gammaproteobacteria bacterium]|nr:MAG: bifunctional diaminohydroxyphosphoribosylaminopyrimidine deaminase/5-amino-6-(5-phosphoribosylamino)uracil reductase RibD [Gammaproteobacteria bacterium]